MSMIPEDVVEATWQEIGGMGPEDIEEIRGLSELQPGLLAFVFTATEDLGEDAAQIAVYIYNVVLRMFQKHAPQGVGAAIDPDLIEQHYDRNIEQLERLEGAHEGFFDRAAQNQIARQPFVMKYILEALFEESPEDDAPVMLSEDEQGALFLVLKTVVDVLDDAVADRPPPS